MIAAIKLRVSIFGETTDAIFQTELSIYCVNGDHLENFVVCFWECKEKQIVPNTFVKHFSNLFRHAYFSILYCIWFFNEAPHLTSCTCQLIETRRYLYCRELLVIACFHYNQECHIEIKQIFSRRLQSLRLIIIFSRISGGGETTEDHRNARLP